jgi:hypothetical protein
MIATVKQSVKRRMPETASVLGTSYRSLRRQAWRAMPDRWVIEQQYRARNGVKPDLERPRALSEKLQWLKLYGMTPLHTTCADKIEVRHYVAKRLGDHVLVPILLATYDVADIRPRNIPAERFVIKTNHDSGTVILCRNRASLDWAACRARLRAAQKRDFYRQFREPQYRNIRRGLLVERFLDSGGADRMKDFKLFCFHGRVELIQVDLDRADAHSQAFFDTDWSRLPLSRNKPVYRGDVPRPRYLERMIAYAEALSEPFRFCRVDFYETDEQIWFGELTFTPDGGYGRFHPLDEEYRLGDLLRLQG